MKLKVNFFDTKLRKSYLEKLTILSTLFSFLFLVIEIPDEYKLYSGIGLLLIFIIIYCVMWTNANNQNEATLNINNSTVIVKIGNIFEEENLKVIAFNEYFDTQVDNRIIADNSLNGIYIKSKVTDVSALDTLIDTDVSFNEKILSTNNTRTCVKKKRYRLGSIYQHNDYLLTAFSRFDDDNRAYLNMNDYINFLLNFWNEIDIIYAGRPISIPLLGSGITRFKEYDIHEQELLELLIWSFKISRIKFTYPSNVSIIIHESKKDKINFYNLKED